MPRGASAGAAVLADLQTALDGASRAIALAHGCTDGRNFQILDGAFIYVIEGTPLVQGAPQITVPAS